MTFGWAPRFLHSTGQFHKGGPQVGVFLQITGAVTEDLDVPGPPLHVRTAAAAQALGDLRALAERGRPVAPAAPHRPCRRDRQLLAAARRPDDGQYPRCGLPPEEPPDPAPAPTRCATRATAGCRGSRTRARWSCSGSPVTWPARS